MTEVGRGRGMFLRVMAAGIRVMESKRGLGFARLEELQEAVWTGTRQR